MQQFPAIWIQAKKIIRVGDEIRVNYGPDARYINAVPHTTHPPLHTIP